MKSKHANLLTTSAAIDVEKPSPTKPLINTADVEFSNDVLVGAAAIAEFLFGDRKDTRKVYYLAERSKLPIFRLNAQLRARKSILRGWIEDQEHRNSSAKQAKEYSD